MYNLPPALFSTTDAAVAVACVVAAALFAVQPQFKRFWRCNPVERVVLGTMLGVLAFGTPILLVDIPGLHGEALKPVLFWVMPWVCLATYLVVAGFGYMRRTHHLVRVWRRARRLALHAPGPKA